LLLQFLENSEEVSENKKLSEIFLNPKEEKKIINNNKNNFLKKEIINNNNQLFEENPYKASIYEPEETFYASQNSLHNYEEDKDFYNFKEEEIPFENYEK
jgi:hypothetical protein